MKHQEHILAVPSAVFMSHSAGFGLEVADLTNEHLTIMQRKGLETNFLYRQIISYSIVRCGNKVLAYRRTPKGNEARLHGQVSIGFGGHVDMEDIVVNDGIVDFRATAEGVTRREIAEEVTLGVVNKVKLLDQYIISNVNDTDRVHAGMLSVVECEHEQAANNEDQVELLGWYTLDELRAEFGEQLESWSLNLLDYAHVILAD